MIHKRTREAKQAMLRTFMETTIAQVAKAVFAERGYQQATLEEIAQPDRDVQGDHLSLLQE